jgi:hypothetical protein
MFLYLFSRSKFKKKQLIRMIDVEQRPINGGGVHLASKTDHF